MKVFLTTLFLLIAGLSDVLGKVFFEERFLKGNIDNWTPSEVEPDKLGKAEFAKAEPVFDEEEDGGLNTTEPARFYRLSSPLKNVLKNKGKDMCIQFSAKYPIGADCGGAYIKLLNEDLKQKDFHGESPYEIMFGPDICGYDTRLVHVIFSHEGKNFLIKDKIYFMVDNMTHLFRLNVFPNNSFSVFVDGELRKNGTLADDFDILQPKIIDDPEDKKPEDWVDEMEIPDPDDKKPDDWDQPETIVDVNATKPDDWNDDTDGEWTAPIIQNPDFKGEWRPKMIPNPEYKGQWTPKQIPNPDFVDDPTLYERQIKYIGLDLWQVQSGTIFDNFIIADDLKECDDHVKYWRKRHESEEEWKKKWDDMNKASMEDVKNEDVKIHTSSDFGDLFTDAPEKEAEKKEEEEEKDDQKLHEEL